MNNNERQLMSANVSAEDLSPHRYSPESFLLRIFGFVDTPHLAIVSMKCADVRCCSPPFVVTRWYRPGVACSRTNELSALCLFSGMRNPAGNSSERKESKGRMRRKLQAQ